MGKGISTINTVLKWGTAAGSVAKVVAVKTVPEIGGSPNMLETTDLEDTEQTFCQGVKQGGDNMEFTCNYTKDAYDLVKADENKDLFYQVEFGASGADGIYSCYGRHTVRISESSVNAVREMVISVARSTPWVDGAATGVTGLTS